MADAKKVLPTKVITDKVRVCYVFVDQARPDDNGVMKYSLCVLIDKKNKQLLTKVQAAVNAAKEDGKAKKWGGKIPPNLKMPLRDGDTERDTPEYKGHYFLNCTSTQKPGILDADGNAAMEAGTIYSGCFARVSINFYPFDAKGNKGVAAGLQNIKFVEDGERLSGRASAEEDFGEDSGGEDFLN